MELSGIGSGVMLALAAGLWLVYLVPSWLRSREFSATERNAVRLQQTLRVLAETAETPASVRAESTARGVLEQEKLMKHQLRQRAAAERAGLAATKAADRPAPSAARRLKRTRAITSIVVLAAFVVLAIQIPTAFISGLSSMGFGVVLFAGIALVSGFALLSRLNEISRSRAVQPVARPAATPRRTTTSRQHQTDVAPAQTTWTPVPVPKPIYLSRDVVAAPAVTPAAVAAELGRASREAELALRAAQAAPEVTQIRQAPVAPPAAPSRFASMGRLSDNDLGSTNIDEVLERRRAAG
ncbi:hypothetical protein BH11ACT2_BH11ACT2_21470 [soil metagenome]